MIGKSSDLSVKRQCELLSVPRSSVYYEPTLIPTEELGIRRALDELHTLYPFMGSRRLTLKLCEKDYEVNRKRVARLMRAMGITAIYPKPRTSKPGSGAAHKTYPYLLKGIVIDRPNLAWAMDITYIPMARGFCYLVAVMDVHSRKVLAWRLSNTLDTRFCLEALHVQRPG